MFYFGLPFYVGVPVGLNPIRYVLKVWGRNIVFWSALDYYAEGFFIRLLTFAVRNFAKGLSLIERGLQPCYSLRIRCFLQADLIKLLFANLLANLGDVFEM